jgi:hypothetical protein
MMDLLHKFLLGGEIFAGAVASLVFVSVAIGSIRHWVDKGAKPFVYPDDVPLAEAKAAAEPYWHRALVALDIFLNVVVLFGAQDETMSTHAWRAAVAGKLWGKLMNLWLNGFQPQHGPQAASGDLERALARVAVLMKALGLSK